MTPQEKTSFLIDDLIQTRGTLREAAAMLREMGTRYTRPFAPHSVFPDDTRKRLSENVDELIVTDTIPESIVRSKDLTNMHAVSIVSLIEKIMTGE